MNVVVQYKGPLLEGKGPAQVKEAIEGTIKEGVAVGQAKVRQQLFVGHGRITGHYRGSVHGEVVDSLHGRIHDSNVVYGPWLETGKRRGEQTRFKGYAMFRNAHEHLKKIIGGILGKHVGKAVKGLGG